jgi:hypothetical protein
MNTEKPWACSTEDIKNPFDETCYKPPAEKSSDESTTAANVQPPDLANSILSVHNSQRADVGVPPLVWSEKLAVDAKVWAEHLTTIGQYVHDYEHLPTLGEAENLASFSVSLGPFAHCPYCQVGADRLNGSPKNLIWRSL